MKELSMISRIHDYFLGKDYKINFRKIFAIQREFCSVLNFRDNSGTYFFDFQQKLKGFLTFNRKTFEF